MNRAPQTRVTPLVIAVGLLLGLQAPAAETAAPSSSSLRTNLMFWHSPSGELAPVKSKADWQQRRAEIVRNLQTVMGRFPGDEKRCPLDVKIESETNVDSFVCRKLTYSSEPGSRVPAFLLVPKAALNSDKKFPAVLALHPTDGDYGYRVVVEPLRDHYRAYARDLANRGYVVLAPSYPLMAGYQPDLKALGYESGTMKAIWDNVRGVDLIESLPFVQKGRVGAIGHSLGGHNAIYTAVFDDRIGVVISSCGFDSYRDYYSGDPANWTHGRGWCQDRYMPKLADYRGRLAEIPFDFYELIAALAPRPLFINAPLSDANFNAASVDKVVALASQLYQFYGVPENLRVAHPPGAHDFPPEIRDQAYDFLDKHLR